jgi:octaprenyl-diphosphate synthase
MLEGKLTLPVIYALNTAQNQEMFELARQVKSHEIDNAGIATLVAFTKEQGGIEYADKRMWDFHRDCVKFLDDYVKDDEIKKSLRAYLDFNIVRSV